MVVPDLVFQICLELDLVRFRKSYTAGAGFREKITEQCA